MPRNPPFLPKLVSMCETIEWIDKTNDDMATSFHNKVNKVVDKGFDLQFNVRPCMKQAKVVGTISNGWNKY